MIGQRIKIDSVYEYEITDIKEGGMGRVLIMSRVSEVDPLLNAIMVKPNMADRYSFVYQNRIAAKTFKNDEFVEEYKALFEREMNIWINIDCINVAKLLKITFIEGKFFAIMPFYHNNLSDFIDNKKVEINFALKCVLEIIHGLWETNKKHGIVHMDLKPENILLNFHENKPSFYICDWGIANIQKEYCSNLASKDTVSFSFVNTMRGMGTLPYMSPERFLGCSADITADIYSLGLIFYKLLLFDLPFNLLSSQSIDEQILSYNYYYVAEDSLRRKFEDKICDVILKCIHPNPDRRYRSYRKLAKAVDKLGKRQLFPLSH